MRIYFGGHLNYYHPQKKRWLEVEIQHPALLKDILEASEIPLGEVFLTVIDGESVDLGNAIVDDHNEVRLYPPAGGG